MNIIVILTAALVISVTVLITAEIRKMNKLIYFAKPLSTTLVIALAFAGLLSAGSDSAYTIMVIAALLFSMGGDIALMPPDSNRKFRIGLVLFLTAHIIYIAAFWSVSFFRTGDIISGVVLISAATGFYLLIRSNLRAMKIPVILYMVVICLMVNRAVATRNPLVIAGAVLFFVSDLLLAFNRFYIKWKYERISLAFYYSGQFFFALSVLTVV